MSISHLYRIYFRDSNQKLFEGENIVSVVNHVVYELNYLAEDIVKIEEVTK